MPLTVAVAVPVSASKVMSPSVTRPPLLESTPNIDAAKESIICFFCSALACPSAAPRLLPSMPESVVVVVTSAGMSIPARWSITIFTATIGTCGTRASSAISGAPSARIGRAWRNGGTSASVAIRVPVAVPSSQYEVPAISARTIT